MSLLRRAAGRSGLLALGASCLLFGWLVAPAGIPFYDGVGAPDEPYRYVAAPPGKATKLPPSTATANGIDLSGGTNATGFQLNSNEFGPQVSIYIPGKALTSAGAHTATVTATPAAPEPPLPADGTITGNVYRVSVTAGATLGTATTGQVILRAPPGFSVIPVMEYRLPFGASWQRLPTNKVGNDIFQVQLVGAGDYAMVLPAHGTRVGGHTGLIAIVIIAGLAVLTLIVIRGVRAIRGESDAAPGRQPGRSGRPGGKSVGGR